MQDHGKGPLRQTLDLAREEERATLRELTVLAPQRDPFRLDTPAHHRNGAWFKQIHAEAMRLKGPNALHIHLRGCHYVALSLEAVKPNGERYRNTEEDWIWLSEKAAKAARFLRYVPFDKVRDARNAPPVIRRFEQPDPEAWISAGEVEVSWPEELRPEPWLYDFRGVQPYKLVLVGEKESLEDVLAPVAEARQADLYLPTGEISDTLIYQLAKEGADDGRPLVIFYFSDCDPEGYAMGANVARKLQAFRELQFPELRLQLRPVALTPAQVGEYGLPSTPLVSKAKAESQLKAQETKRRNWIKAHGVEQTEIDAIATLQPDLLWRIALQATRPFFDAGLAETTRKLKQDWLERAEAALTEQLGEEELERIREQAEAKLEQAQEQIEELEEALRVEAEVEGIELPEIPKIPEGEADLDGLPEPLIDSDWSWGEQTRRLIAYKRYE